GRDGPKRFHHLAEGAPAPLDGAGKKTRDQTLAEGGRHARHPGEVARRARTGLCQGRHDVGQRRRTAWRRRRAHRRGVARAGIIRGRMTEIVKVALSERSYDIHVGHGLLDVAGALLKPLARGPLPVVTDLTVGEIHLADFLDTCGKAGLDAHPIVLPPGEDSKSFAGLAELSRELLDTGV